MSGGAAASVRRRRTPSACITGRSSYPRNTTWWRFARGCVQRALKPRRSSAACSCVTHGRSRWCSARDEHRPAVDSRGHRGRPDRPGHQPAHQHLGEPCVAARGARRRDQHDRHRTPVHRRRERAHDRRGPLAVSGRLETDTIELYYLHRVDRTTPIETSVRAIKDYQDQGKIRHIGLSEVSVEQIEQARTVATIAAVQNEYSLSQRRWDDVVDYCAEHGIPFVPYFPVRGQRSAMLSEIAASHGATPQQVALAWLLKRSPTTVPIPGTLSIEHMRQNLDMLELELTDDEYRALM